MSCFRRRSASGTSTRSSLRARSRSLVVIMAAGAGYAISQLDFPGRRLFWWMILASFMVPIPALIVNHFILMSQFRLINTLGGRRRAAAHRPGHGHHLQAVLRFRTQGFSRGGGHRWRERLPAAVSIYLPMNWGVTTALGDHHLYRRLEPFPVAVPGRDRGQDEYHRRHHASA